MNIPEIIKEHHQAMIDKGFYDCPECFGRGGSEISFDPPVGVSCPSCEGSGIDQNKNIGELLMLIVSELIEALEAHRTNNFADKKMLHSLNIETLLPPGIGKSEFNLMSIYQEMFEKIVKNTFEDEIADIYLRLFDLCGYLGIEPELSYPTVLEYGNNTGENLGKISKLVLNYFEIRVEKTKWSGFLLSSLNKFCSSYNIPIEKHILAKMQYNKTRPHKHGKEY